MTDSSATKRLQSFKAIANLWRLFKQLWREHPLVTLGLMATLFLAGGIPALEILVLGRFVGEAQALVDGRVPMQVPMLLLATFIGLMVLRNWLHLVRSTIEDYVRDQMSASLNGPSASR